MKLQDQVCTLEQAKKIKELGTLQESIFSWWPIPKVIEGGAIERIGYEILQSNHARTYGSQAKFSAFTVAELGMMIPRVIRKDGMRYRFRANKESNGLWHLKIRTLSKEGKMIPLCITQNLNEAQARADMLIKLLEKELVTPQWINDLLK